MMLPSPHFLNDPDGTAEFLARTRSHFDRACALRDDYMTLWQECYTYTLPENAQFTGTLSSPGKARAAIFDGTAPDAVDQLAASLLAYLTPPWTNWFSIDPGHGLEDTQRTALMPLLSQSTRILQNQIDQSTLYTDLHQCFLDLVVGGTACLAIYPNTLGSPVRFCTEAIPLNDIILGANSRGEFTTVYRQRTITSAECTALRELSIPLIIGSTQPLEEDQASQSPPSKQSNSESRLSNDEDFIEIIEFCIPDQGKYLIGAFTVNQKSNADLIYVRPHETSPYLIFRWQKTPGIPFGRSPVMKILPDIKCANTVVELILKNASIAATGIWQAEDDGVLNISNIQLSPGTIITKAMGSAGLTPLNMPARFDVSQLVLDDLRARIRHALLVDRFAALDTPRMTATEVRERSAETLHILGAVFGRLQGELLTPLLTHLYDILKQIGEIDDIPLDGRTALITHQSPMARLHAHRGIQTTLTWIDALNRIGHDAPTLIQLQNTARYLAEILGVPEYLIQENSSQPLHSSHN